jgi:hypothetical protein
MLLRARSEYDEANSEIVSLVSRQKVEFRSDIAKRVHDALGYDDAGLSTRIWLLFEGATAAASVAGASVVDDAKDAALTLLDIARVRTG